MASPSARWRPRNDRRSLTYYRWTSWLRLVLAVAVAAATIAGLIRGTANVVGAVSLLFVVVFIGSTEIWRLQGIRAIEREHRETPPASR
ncbi:MAG: hypothetical protein ACTHMH_10445 [Curtobacterium sp.]